MEYGRSGTVRLLRLGHVSLVMSPCVLWNFTLGDASCCRNSTTMIAPRCDKAQAICVERLREDQVTPAYPQQFQPLRWGAKHGGKTPSWAFSPAEASDVCRSCGHLTAAAEDLEKCPAESSQPQKHKRWQSIILSHSVVGCLLRSTR